MTLGPKFSLSKTGEDNLGASSHAPQRGRRIAAQFPRVAHDQVPDLVLFEVRPQVFDRIEFRRVGRQRCHLQAPLGGGNEVFDQPAAMDHSSIPEDQQRRAQVAQEHFEKFDNLRAFDRTGMDLKIEVPEGDSRNDRKTLPAESLLENRRLAARRPSAHPVRPRAQAAFVDENNGAPLAARFFFSFGQVERCQCAIFSSSRSRARRVGR